MEIWKDIPKYENYYQASTYGRIKSLDRRLANGRFIKGVILKFKYDKDGYLDVSLSKNGERKTYKVHRLIGKTFISNPNHYKMINHKNGKRDDNNVENLEWCDNSYNQWHRCHINKKPPNNDYKKKTVKAINDNGAEMYFDSVTECAKYFKVSRTAIERKLKNKAPNPSYDLRKPCKRLYGIKFEYVV